MSHKLKAYHHLFECGGDCRNVQLGGQAGAHAHLLQLLGHHHVLLTLVAVCHPLPDGRQECNGGHVTKPKERAIRLLVDSRY